MTKQSDEVETMLAELSELRDAARRADAAAAAAMRQTAVTLTRAHGLTMRDAASKMGVSHQRVAQLVEGVPQRKRKPTPSSTVPKNRAVGQLGFELPEVERILDGSKTVTIREAHKAPKLGKVLPLRCKYDESPFARAEVLNVRPLNRRKLTEQDARAAGRASVDELRDALRTRYPRGDLVAIEFKLVPSP
jgi:uncharacterized protein YqfB (UPF0267 family)